MSRVVRYGRNIGALSEERMMSSAATQQKTHTNYAEEDRLYQAHSFNLPEQSSWNEIKDHVFATQRGTVIDPEDWRDTMIDRHGSEIFYQTVS